MSTASGLHPTFAVVDLFDHSAPRMPEDISRGPSSKSFASISIGRGGISLNNECHGENSPRSPAKATRMFSKKSVTINEELVGDDESSLLSSDDFDVNATSRRRRNSWLVMCEQRSCGDAIVGTSGLMTCDYFWSFYAGRAGI